MLRTCPCFSPHNHQDVLLNGRPNGPFGKQKMGRKGRVLSVPSSHSLFLYKGDPKPYFRFLLRYYFVRTLKKFLFYLFSPPLPSLTTFKRLSATPFLQQSTYFSSTSASTSCYIMMDEINYPNFILKGKNIYILGLFFALFFFLFPIDPKIIEVLNFKC